MRGVDDNEFGYKVDLWKSLLCWEIGNVEVESFVIEGLLYGWKILILGFRVGIWCKSVG